MIENNSGEKTIEINDNNRYQLTFYLLLYYSLTILLSLVIIRTTGFYISSKLLPFIITVYISIPIFILSKTGIRRGKIIISDTKIELWKRAYSRKYFLCFDLKWEDFEEINVKKEKAIKPATPGIHSGSFTSETFIFYTFIFIGPNFNKTLKLGDFIFKLAVNEQLLKTLKGFSKKKNKILHVNDDIIESISHSDQLSKARAIERQIKANSERETNNWKRFYIVLIVVIILIIILAIISVLN